jgi:YrbI family 3-deoxy-D-manno-octulosonate 8-phosphate phosphatase
MPARLRSLRLVAFDFDGVFTDNTVWVFEDGREAVRCSRADGIGLDKLRGLGIELAIISTEVNPVVSARARKLKLRCIQACNDKSAALADLARSLDVDLSRTAFVGNDVNDLPAFAIAGMAIAVADAHPEAANRAAWITTARGGHGAVREICDRIADAHSEARK